MASVCIGTGLTKYGAAASSATPAPPPGCGRPGLVAIFSCRHLCSGEDGEGCYGGDNGNGGDNLI